MEHDTPCRIWVVSHGKDSAAHAATRSGSALAAGTNAEISYYVNSGTRTVRLDGATVGQGRLSLQNYSDGLRHVRVLGPIRDSHDRKNPRRFAAPI